MVIEIKKKFQTYFSHGSGKLNFFYKFFYILILRFEFKNKRMKHVFLTMKLDF
jgi:hypothetical protein